MKKTIKRIAFLLLFVSLAFGTTVGPTLVGTGADGGGGAVGWVNPGNITANDGVLATATSIAVSQNTNFLNGTMGANAFSVPAGATILGIQVDAVREAAQATDVVEATIQLLKAGTRVGTNQTLSNFLPTTLTSVTYGGSSNLWGTTWTSSEVNASNFGVSFQWSIGTNGDVVSVDYMQITVTYTPPAGGMGKRVIRTQTRTARQQAA